MKAAALPIVTTAALLAGGCGMGPGSDSAAAGAHTVTIHGHLSHPDGVAFAPGALMVVELRDDADERVLTEQRTTLPAQPQPMNFVLQFDSHRFNATHRHTVRGAVLAQGGAQWLTEAVAVDIEHGRIDLGGLRLVPVQRPLAFQSTIRCGTRNFSIGMLGDTMHLRDGTSSFALQAVPAGSDSRLEAVADPSTYVWSQGEQARVSVRGQAYADCVVLAPRASDKVSR